MNDDLGKQLHDNERLYQNLFTAVNEGLAICEIVLNKEGNPEDYRYLEVNPAFETVIGLSSVQVRGKTQREVGSIEPSWLELFGEVIKAGKPASRVDYYPKFDKWFDLRVYGLSGERFAFLIMDVTEYKQSEKRYREAEQKYKDLVRYAPTGIYEVDFQRNKFIFVNDFMCKQLGYSREELLDMGPIDLMDDRSKELFQSRTRQWLAGFTPGQKVEYKVKTKDGQEFYAVLSIIFKTDENEKPLGAIAIVHDITDLKRMEEELRQSNERFSALIEATSQVIWETDYKGLVVDNTPVWRNHTGRIIENWLGYGWLDAVHPDDREYTRNIWRESVTTGRRLSTEVRIKSLTGGWKWVNVYAAPIRDLYGNILKWVGMNIDISERKLVEEALRESEAHLRLAIQTARMFTWEIDVPSQAFQFSQNAVEVVGFPVPTAIAELYLLPHPDDQTIVIKAFDQASKKGGQFEVECRVINPVTDEVVWLLSAGVAFYNSDGLPIRIVGVTQNITERKRAEAEVLASERELLRVTLNSLGEGVIAVDSEERIFLINDTATRLTGFSVDEAIGKPLNKVFYILDVQTSESIVIKASQQIFRGMVLVDRDLHEIPVAINTSAIKAADGQIIGTVIIFQDITEKLKIERELLKTEKLESIGVLAGGIAHDFNNVLAAIMANIQLAQYKLENNQDIRKYLLNTVETARKASDLTKQLLTFSRGGAPVKKNASLIDLIRDTTDFVLRGSKVKAKFSIPETLWTASIDEGQISQVLHNIVINAEQAMPKGGIIHISAKNIILKKASRLNPGNYIKIIVKDHGIGIPEENLTKIFDPFFTTKKDGNGLGLATSYSIINQHNGYIEVESGEGKGTSFVVYLPASRTAVFEVKPEPEVAVTGVKLKILLMDDEESILNAIGEILEGYGYQVVLTKDGTEMIEQYQHARKLREPFNVVIMDLTIPGGMGGQEAIAHLRKIDPNVRAIISSGYANDLIVSNFKKYGFSGVVTKPYNFDELIEVINQVVEG